MSFSNQGLFKTGRDSTNTSDLSRGRNSSALDAGALIDIGIDDVKHPHTLKSSASSVLNKAYINYDYDDSESDEASSEHDSTNNNRDNESRNGSDYKANLSYLLDQGIMVKEIPTEYE